MQWDWGGEPLALPEMVALHNGGAPFGLIGSPPYPSNSYWLSVHDYWYPPASGILRPTRHLYQTGHVPHGAVELRYVVDNPPYPCASDCEMKVYVNNVQQHVQVQGVLDVTQFAGQEVKLEFVFPSGPAHYYLFDAVGFVVIPEASSLTLIGLGVCAVLGQRWIKHCVVKC